MEGMKTMDNHEDSRWLEAIDTTYTPKAREIAVPDATSLTPRPVWRRPISVILASLVLAAIMVLGLGL